MSRFVELPGSCNLVELPAKRHAPGWPCRRDRERQPHFPAHGLIREPIPLQFGNIDTTRERNEELSDDDEANVQQASVTPVTPPKKKKRVVASGQGVAAKLGQLALLAPPSSSRQAKPAPKPPLAIRSKYTPAPRAAERSSAQPSVATPTVGALASVEQLPAGEEVTSSLGLMVQTAEADAQAGQDETEEEEEIQIEEQGDWIE